MRFKNFNFELISPMRETLKTAKYCQKSMEVPKNFYFPVLWLFRIDGNKFDCCQLRFLIQTKVNDKIAFLSYGILCDGDRVIYRNGSIPNVNCK